MSWHILQVMSGEEEKVKKELCRIGFEAKVPMRNILHRNSQAWVMLERPVFPGYVFVNIYNLSAFLHHKVMSGQNYVKILNEEALPAADEKFVDVLCEQKCIGIHALDENGVALNGMFKGKRCKSRNARQRRAMFELEMAGITHLITVSTS